MAPKDKTTKLPDNQRTLLIMFTKDGLDYRMRVACVHVHPGERDRIEVASKAMLGETSWNAIPDGSSKVPSSEWLIRRALWMDFTRGMNTYGNNETGVIELGEI